MSQKNATPFPLRHWPLALTLLLTALGILVVATASRARNEGHLIYALDDAYIHLAMAKNFAFHGVWGVTRYEFTSASSSPLWTLLLATLMRLLGNHETLPFWVNLGCSAGLFGLAYAYLKRQGLSQPVIALGLLTLAVAMPVIPMVFAGMEHILHALLSLAFLWALGEVLAERAAPRAQLWLLILGALLPLVRYEGLFLIAAAFAILLWRRTWRVALALLVASLLPMTLYGMIAVAHGWWFLPSTLLIKGHLSADGTLFGLLRSILDRAAHNLGTAPQLGFLMFAAGAAALSDLRAQAPERRREGWILLAYLGAALMHIALASVAWFFRYQAYLMALGAVLLTPALARLSLERWFKRPLLRAAAQVLVALLVWGLALAVGLYALVNTPRATSNIYQQQYQMGRFLATYYNGRAVALNDIGATSYLSDIRLVDLVGLASREVARAHLEGTFDARLVDDLTRRAGVVIAILYKPPFADNLPAWREVAAWRIPENLVCGFDTVYFYAVTPEAEADLVEQLRAFAGRLPAAVAQEGAYLRP